MCPNTDRNIDQIFKEGPILGVQNVAKNDRYIDIKNAKCVQILLGISTKISQKGQF